MIYKKFFYLIILLLVITSNKCKSKYTEVVIEVDYKKYIIDTIAIKKYSNDDIVKFIKIGQNAGYFIQNKDFRKLIFTNDKGVLIKELAYDSLASGIEHTAFNSDTIYLFTRKNEIYTFDINGKFIQKNTITCDTHYYFAAWLSYPFEVKDGLAFMYQFYNNRIMNTTTFFKYIQTVNDVIFNLKTNQIEPNTNKGFQIPILYKNYNVYNADRIINNNKELVYSYNHSSNIYTYNYINQQKKVYKSNYRPEIIRTDTIIYENKIDPDYESRYSLEHKCYYSLIYNPFKNCYYRFLLDSIPFENSEGEINEFDDKPMELEIIDHNFVLQKIIKIPKRQFRGYTAIPCKEGILILTDKQNKPKHTTYVKLSL